MYLPLKSCFSLSSWGLCSKNCTTETEEHDLTDYSLVCVCGGYMNVCVHTHVHVFMYEYICTCTHVSVCIHVLGMFICLCLYMWVHAHVNMCMYVCMGGYIAPAQGSSHLREGSSPEKGQLQWIHSSRKEVWLGPSYRPLQENSIKIYLISISL